MPFPNELLPADPLANNEAITRSTSRNSASDFSESHRNNTARSDDVDYLSDPVVLNESIDRLLSSNSNGTNVISTGAVSSSVTHRNNIARTEAVVQSARAFLNDIRPGLGDPPQNDERQIQLENRPESQHSNLPQSQLSAPSITQVQEDTVGDAGGVLLKGDENDNQNRPESRRENHQRHQESAPSINQVRTRAVNVEGNRRLAVSSKRQARERYRNVRIKFLFLFRIIKQGFWQELVNKWKTLFGLCLFLFLE